MTTDQLMKKMGLKSKKNPNRVAAEKIKTQISKYIKDGKNKLLTLEQNVKDGKKYKNIQAGVGRSKAKLREAKKNFGEFEKKAEQFIEKNPKKAVAMAAAAGALAGGLWASFKTKKPVLKKKK